MMNLVDFGANPSWCHRFMRHSDNLSVRSTTTVGQRLPADWEDKTRFFQTFVNNLQRTVSLPQNFANMMQLSCTQKQKMRWRVTSVSDNRQQKKTNFFALSCLADGTKQKPLLIFKRKTLPKESLPQCRVVTCNIKGWMNQEVMTLWAERVWRGRPGAFFKVFLSWTR